MEDRALLLFDHDASTPLSAAHILRRAPWDERMDWTVISAVSGLVQSAVVVAGLWYVTVQLRQNTKAVITSSLQEILEADIGIISG
jgi:hypothetical protein